MRWISVVTILTLFCALSSEVLAGAVDRANVSIVVTVAEADDAVNAARISACKQARNANRPVCRALASQSSSSRQVVPTPSTQSSGQTSVAQASVQLQTIAATLQSTQSASQEQSVAVAAAAALGTLLSLSSTEQSQFISSQIHSSESEGEVRFTVASI